MNLDFHPIKNGEDETRHIQMSAAGSHHEFFAYCNVTKIPNDPESIGFWSGLKWRKVAGILTYCRVHPDDKDCKPHIDTTEAVR